MGKKRKKNGGRSTFGTVFQRGSTWYIQYPDPHRPGKRIKQAVSPFEDVARDKLIEICARIGESQSAERVLSLAG